MGEIAEMMLDGALCEGCGVAMGDGKSPGYPRKCSDCLPSSGPLVRKVKCEKCGRRVRKTGLQDHMRAVHP